MCLPTVDDVVAEGSDELPLGLVHQIGNGVGTTEVGHLQERLATHTGRGEILLGGIGRGKREGGREGGKEGGGVECLGRTASL